MYILWCYFQDSDYIGETHEGVLTLNTNMRDLYDFVLYMHIVLINFWKLKMCKIDNDYSKNLIGEATNLHKI